MNDCIKAVLASAPERAGKTWKTGDVIKPDPHAVDQAKAAIEEKLKDPNSAQFEIEIVVDKNVCGKVNAKNSYGGYVGRTRFMWNGDTGHLIMDDEKDPILAPLTKSMFDLCDNWEAEAKANGGKVRRK